MTPRRSALAALAALLLVVSAAALSSPAAGQGDDANQTRDENDSSQTGGDGAQDGQASGEDDAQTSKDDDRGPPDDRGEDRRPERTGPENREVRVEVDEARAEFRSEARDGDARSELRMDLRGEEAALSLDYENRTDEGRVEVEMSVRHALLVEFRDADGDGVRDPGEATVQTVDLRGRTPAVSVNETAVGPRVTSTYDLPGNGTFTTTVLLPSGPARVGDQAVTPDEAKVDFRIDGFPFEANGTHLDLQVDVDAAYEARDSAADASGLTLPSEGAAGYFRWLPNATVDGEVRDVGARVDAVEATAEDGEAETQYVVHLAYASGQTIVHDPTFGIQSVGEAVEAAQQVLGHLPTYAVVAGATAALVVGIGYARARGGPP